MFYGIGCSARGEVCFVIAVSGPEADGSTLPNFRLAGFLSRAFCTPILSFGSTLCIPDKSRMREFRSYGSVRGVLGTRHPYRDRNCAISVRLRLLPNLNEQTHLTFKINLLICSNH